MREDLRVPRATYRLQLHRGFTFRDATALVPYLAQLGISHIYCSPYLKARSGSTHGYDIVDHQSLNPEIGTPEDFEALAAALDAHGMGQVMDVVPNHMGIMGADNAWWLDVLENGQSSAYADFFDIDWQPASADLLNRVLVPVLGDHYAAVLSQGQLILECDHSAGTFHVCYHHHRFPLGPRSYGEILQRAAAVLEEGNAGQAAARMSALAGAFEALPQRDDLAPESRALRQDAQLLCKRQLADLCRDHPEAGRAIGRVVAQYRGTPGEAESFDLLHELLQRQAYRLAYWRVASEEINYRRFFDINELAALRMENDAAFDATHRLILDLVGRGRVHALRIDHPDGLLDPGAYLERLQQAFREATGAAPEERIYVAVEKIIAPFESMPQTWPVDGTTGYRFAGLVNGLFVDGRAQKRFTRVYEAFIADRSRFEEVVQRSKAMVLRDALASELAVLANRLARIARADRSTRDYTLNMLRRALSDVIAAFPVYRTYIAREVSPDDRRFIDWALARAKRHSRAADLSIYEFVRGALTCELSQHGADPEDVRMLARRFQQLTAPVMAKGVEDTAFYIYNRLISLNDVGSDPAEFGIGVNAFHGASADRAAKWPQTMLATSTHDNKRSEDVRTRIDVLSESPAAWRMRLSKWSRMNRGKKRNLEGESAPTPNDEYLIYQTLVGSLPLLPMSPEDLEAYRERVARYVLKAMREAKVRSSWVNPDEEYEAAVGDFLQALLSTSGLNLFLQDLKQLVESLGWYGLLNSLSLVLIKFTSPGVPDTYQGNEVLDFSLVDPDNRRPVDYGLRRRLLDEVRRIDAGRDTAALHGMFGSAADGRAKLYFTWKLLALRRERPELFREGGYTALHAIGSRAAHVVAFARRNSGAGLVTIAGRLFTNLAGPRELPCGVDAWADTRVRIPFLREGTRLADALSGRTHVLEDGCITLAHAWHDLPGAALVFDEGDIDPA